MTDPLPADLIPGAEPWSHAGGPAGALVLHGFTGNPGSMRGLAEALAAAGFTVELPLLPGHGTKVEDMIPTGFPDWLAAAEAAYQSLAARCEQVVVVGLSMGGALTAWLGSEHPEIAGLVCINAVVSVPEGMREAVTEVLASGADRFAGIGSDIAAPGVVESAYAETPLAPLLTMFDAADNLGDRLSRITSPLLVVTSTQDHVVPPENSDLLAEQASGPVERLRCERSFHVVTMDHDKDLVAAATVDFATKVTAGAGQ
ncbi:alpha/beta fold hydrolase [Aquihabitans sp. G128]|uniref:alpha/beta hydrolase n=1 Tax=Aquihabitans sp. G128 TaxID=2849779 RepID=UPI001C237BBA|nr:alpha/beta fold hydrolase [Aquihabitans sp. G128]QXC63106.1 alpha/beta fold hydrolase [Aquihabitans sp. G128]